MSHSGYAPRIKAIRLSDMFLTGPKMAPPDTPAIRRHREKHILDAIEAEANHVCQYGEPGVCEDCTRLPKARRGSARFQRIEKARAKRRAEINGAPDA